uniref:Uncharacterized protein n=1 Tax=Candidatus Kentrum sp. TUN TaxID=2126343 RepID=A0A450ZIT4_9GAMM|nr:MAG: hypothetical protein BECKTUN1418F_GA0071002_10281 [Candidatus Kentron sp. TUN]VFK57738.1 MAG: hypothetical protein BECKTUN1418D_GA0071000_10691 [Candidatus Kentron sp. TUN]VFK61591.1 MAG: hypothetical protein BECKTUN1418E_GA0071001_106814 [Candidatus Kentron sp. TUN]
MSMIDKSHKEEHQEQGNLKSPGRPVENIIEPINDTPERVALSIMNGDPKTDWDYLNVSEKQKF